MLEDGQLIAGYDDHDNPIYVALPELRPCPRCEAKVKWQEEDGDILIFCPACDTTLYTEYFENLDDAARHWNSRPLEDRLRERIAELEKLLSISAN